MDGQPEREPHEMSHSSQLIAELDAAGVAPLKQLGFWAGLHENTIRDYRDGRIKHFGTEMRFWNAVLVGLTAGGAVHPFAFRITGMLLKGTPLAATSVKSFQLRDENIAATLRRFAPMTRDLADAMDHAAAIYADGRVTAADDPNICELETKLDQLINQAWQIKHAIGRERMRVTR